MTELRIILAGLLGGGVIFCLGAMNHMMFQLGDRTVKNVPNEETMKSAITEQKLEYGIYRFPAVDEEMLKNEEGMKALNERYKAGPNGMIFLGRTGEDMMTGRELGLEFGSNVLFALLCAWVVSKFRPEGGFFWRWMAVPVIGVAAWLSLMASMHIWYRFHWDFVRDELYCVLIETVIGGLVIAALTWPEKAKPAANK